MVINLLPILNTAGAWLLKILKLDFKWSAEKPLQRRVALIVEDDPLDAEILSNYLWRSGCDYDIAVHAEIAQFYVKQNVYMLAFVDLMLPGLPGQRLISEIKRHNPSMYIVVVSGSDLGLADIANGVHIGFIKKNVTLESVEEVVQLVFGSVNRRSK